MFTANISVSDFSFEVCIYWDRTRENFFINELLLNGKPVEVAGLFVSQKDQFIPLEDYLLQRAVERLNESGGALAHDRDAAAVASAEFSRDEDAA